MIWVWESLDVSLSILLLSRIKSVISTHCDFSHWVWDWNHCLLVWGRFVMTRLTFYTLVSSNWKYRLFWNRILKQRWMCRRVEIRWTFSWSWISNLCLVRIYMSRRWPSGWVCIYHHKNPQFMPWLSQWGCEGLRNSMANSSSSCLIWFCCAHLEVDWVYVRW